ncbi:alkaline phosphatase family protein [Sandaracinomonas limnophila]|uniref:Alkaline phosphatase family protein n=1 Tax=Sandaracinomonas limnophila TaxID=1862386 RepID=A0A437PW06_9BACT|nr:alkaline phosphatase PafA [Sandaracinomonas limnophila]RVU26439.1 alkaline phosphatase family protein [Sandaracinomonas limnophila]
MKNSSLFILAILLLANSIFAQKTSSTVVQSKPKLVVGIIVDQMRYDYLNKYYSRFSEGGFKRMMNQGINCTDNHYSYAPTVTAAGHASVYTGTTPAVHGIVGNDWTDVLSGKKVYCTDDSTVQTVGTTGKTGWMSPKNLWTSTITDQLRLAQNFKNKTIAIALKDRGAILPGGHTANGAYWYDSKEGNWITSTFYMKELPAWVQKFNSEKQAENLTKNPWNTFFPINTYTLSAEDDQAYEGKYPGAKTSTFPHSFEGTNALEVIRTSPMGNTLTKNFAIRSIDEEKLGQGNSTDFLAVSFSSPDYIGHTFGPQSIELEDNYIRLDRDIEEILNHLDTKIGKGNYLVFLSADHAVADVPGYLQSKKLPGGVYDRAKALTEIKNALKLAVGTGDLIIGEENSQLYLDPRVMKRLQISRELVFQTIEKALNKTEGFSRLIDLKNLENTTLINGFKDKITNGYHPLRSGDFMILLKPQWFVGSKTGTTHSTLYAYDTHVPLLFYGWKVPAKRINSRTEINDIAPTLSNLLKIMEPTGTTGKVILTN